MFRVNGLLQVAQRATDLPRATAFYRDVLGLPLLAEFDPPGLVFFDLGGSTRLLLDAHAPSTLLYLEVADIHHAVEHLSRVGVVFHQGAHLIHRHDGTFDAVGVEEWMAFFHDSEGNQLALVECRQPPAG
jgi:methylmalonyl-CoA/ethylmalonyl-CoA epimerase